MIRLPRLACAALLLAAPAFVAPAFVAPAFADPPAGEKADSITLYFDNGSAKIRPEDRDQLDRAARTFREGKPIVMMVSGGSDASGNPQSNLRLSQKRAFAVYRGLVARGIPAERFQIVAKGETDPAVPADPSDAKNRRADITWR